MISLFMHLPLFHLKHLSVFLEKLLNSLMMESYPRQLVLAMRSTTISGT